MIRIMSFACALLMLSGDFCAAQETAPPAASPVFDAGSLAGLRARSIGPAVMSGRIAAIDATATEPPIVYVGAASGGLWKSVDGAVNFEPVFDEHPQSIGAVRIDPKDPKTVWVGTGESWVRNSVSAGAGVYRTTDGGTSFQPMGLEQTERIAEIVVSQLDSQLVYVCATGALWNASEHRGVYRSRDGGAHWERVLYVDDGTGCSDLAIDPANPNVLYAGMWTFRRSPDFFQSGGKGSALYRSFDGGQTWTVLSAGLPSGEKGRIAIAIAPSRSHIVYAIVEAKKTALYRSDDMGNHWVERNAGTNIGIRPFYFGELVVDPQDPERVYRPAFSTTRSDDGGKTFGSMMLGGGPHADHHALWIHPKRPNWMLLGTDGGLYVSEDGSHKWRHVRTLPISQFYHVNVDRQQPYNVYGGLQDNGSWMAPSRGASGVRLKDWQSVGFGDGFWVSPDPEDPDIVYSEYQGGMLLRVHRRLGEVKRIAPSAAPDAPELRFNWNTPYLIGPSGALYVGSQYLHRSTDRGESWQQLSPDLTTNDPQRQRQASSGGLSVDNSTAENNTTIYTIAESALDPQLLWVGTDDGLVQVSRDGGTRWTEVGKGLPGVPRGSWISRIEASPHAAGTAFVTVDDHRRGDFAPHLFRTDDFGQHWQRIDTSAVAGWAWVIRQDPERADLLYLGTEQGLWISLDGGRQWARFQQNLPPVAVHDLVFALDHQDLVIATHGRGVYIVDDLTPLRALTPELLARPVALLPARPAVLVAGGALQDFSGIDEHIGSSPPDAAIIGFHQSKRHLFGDLRLEVLDAEGKPFATIPVEKNRGMVRVEWPMRLKPPRLPPSTQLVPAMFGPRVPEGSYRYVLVKGKERLEGTIELVADPRSPHSAEDRKAQQALVLKVYQDLSDLTFLSDQLSELSTALEALPADLPAATRKRAAALLAELVTLRKTLAATSTAGYVSGEEQLRERYGNFYGDVSGYDGRPSQSQMARYPVLRSQLDQAKANADRLLGERLPALSGLLEQAGKPPLKLLERSTWEAREQGSGGSGSLLRWALPLFTQTW